MDKKFCPHCGAKMMRYKHTLNAQMASALRRLAMAGGEANLNELNLERNQWDNFQKMRYFDLVRYAFKEDGTRASGVWAVTERGYRFLSGKSKVRKRVETYRGQRTRYLGTEWATMKSLKVEKWRQKDDYSGDAEPHE